MKTRTWIILLAAGLALCAVLALLILPREAAPRARILSGGTLIREVDLSQDQSFTVEARDGHCNVITVQSGAIAVTEATCPDHYCMHRGFCRSGSPIVCLPNKLVIEFVGETDVDMIS